MAGKTLTNAIQQALAALEQEDYRTAWKCAQRLRKQHPSSVHVDFLYASILVKEERWARARPYLENMIKAAPGAADVWERLATCYRELNAQPAFWRAVDQGLACYFQYYQSRNGYSYRLDALGERLAQFDRLAEWMAGHLPNPMMNVHYEALIRDPEGIGRAVCEFLGLNPDQIDFSVSKKNRALMSQLNPVVSHDQPMPLSADFIGWSKPYHQWLPPFRTAYQQGRERA